MPPTNLSVPTCIIYIQHFVDAFKLTWHATKWHLTFPGSIGEGGESSAQSGKNQSDGGHYRDEGDKVSIGVAHGGYHTDNVHHPQVEASNRIPSPTTNRKWGGGKARSDFYNCGLAGHLPRNCMYVGPSMRLGGRRIAPTYAPTPSTGRAQPTTSGGASSATGNLEVGGGVKNMQCPIIP